jgi:dolichyl-diphosphooligosaccharide--protein glycosyltransferase
VAIGTGMLLGWTFEICLAMLLNYWTTPLTKAESKKIKKTQGPRRYWLYSKWIALNQYKLFILIKWCLALAVLGFIYLQVVEFHQHSAELAPHLSEPQIMLSGTNQLGEKVVVDDYREAYFWLRDNTPEDSRVLAWWDYGYQINGIANRTTIADGNTWNHEHIALLGRCLISPERKAHRIIRHLADYVLVWSSRWVGIYGDDLAKCPHMARIASSVFFDIDHKQFYMTGPDTASPALSRSLLFNLHGYGMNPSVPKPKYFEEAFTTKNAMVRIYKVKNVAQESKKFVAANHTYPPALADVLSKSNSFQREREELYLNL